MWLLDCIDWRSERNSHDHSEQRTFMQLPTHQHFCQTENSCTFNVSYVKFQICHKPKHILATIRTDSYCWQLQEVHKKGSTAADLSASTNKVMVMNMAPPVYHVSFWGVRSEDDYSNWVSWRWTRGCASPALFVRWCFWVGQKLSWGQLWCDCQKVN